MRGLCAIYGANIEKRTERYLSDENMRHSTRAYNITIIRGQASKISGRGFKNFFANFRKCFNISVERLENLTEISKFFVLVLTQCSTKLTLFQLVGNFAAAN